VTAAPASAAARASAKPILPELVFVIPRTGSIASNVGPGGNEHAPAREDLGHTRRHDRVVDLQRFQHPSVADLAAGLVARRGAEDADAVGTELRDVAPRRRVRPHLHVHRGRDEERALAREAERREQVVGVAVRELREEVGRRGRDDDRVGAARDRDVVHRVGRAGGPQVGRDRPAGQRLERRRRHEARRRLGHHDVDGDARLHEQACELGGLVGGDAAGDAENDAGERRAVRGSCRVHAEGRDLRGRGEV